MTFSHFNRRFHIYLGMVLLPWFLMYGLSAVTFVHGGLMSRILGTKDVKPWRPLFERAYDAPVPTADKLNDLGEKIKRDAGLSGLHGTYRENDNQINVYVYTFLRSTQLKYFVNEKRLIAEDKNFRLDHFLTGMHTRAGFREGLLGDLWAVLVSIVAIGMLGWVASGLYMWWQLKSKRWLGLVALLAGAISFIAIVFRL